MKKITLLCLSLALAVANDSNAQTRTSPWMIGIGMHGENHKAVKAHDFGGSLTNFKGIFDLDNFNAIYPPSKITLARNINRYFVADWQTTFGNAGNDRFFMKDNLMFMSGLGIQFKINSLWNEDSWFDPYIRLGGNYLRHDYTSLNNFPLVDANSDKYDTYNGTDLIGKKNHFAIAGGAGANFWFSRTIGLGLQADYVTTPLGKTDVTNFFQGSASLLFRIGNKAVKVKDTDGDGIADKDDKCPTLAGPAENGGCPWPDTDGDGVLDKDDKCPNVAGPAENYGCPWPDTDGDGIPDKDDKCPNVFGLKEYDGCPKPKSVTAIEVSKTLENIYFDMGKATIKAESLSKLDAAAEIIKKDGGNYLVTGATDKKGSDAINLRISKERAAAVVKALIQRGVDPSTLKSIGVGEALAKVPETASDAERMSDRKVFLTAIEDQAEWDKLPESDVPVKKKK